MKVRATVVPLAATLATMAMLETAIMSDRSASAQGAAQQPALRQEIERRFDVIPLHDGLALRPKFPADSAKRVKGLHGVRSIEFVDKTIAIDGVPATGAELRDRLGEDAELVIRLSYLDAAARRALFETPDASRPPATPLTPERPERGDQAPAEAPSLRPDSESPPVSKPRRTRRGDDRVRIGGSVTIDPDETVNDIVVIGGSAHVQGEVTGDVVVIGGLVELGPHAEVRNDVTVVGGRVRRDPGSSVHGRVNEIGPGLKLSGLRFGHTHFSPAVLFWGSTWVGLFGLLSTLMRVVILCGLASLIVLVGGDYVEHISGRAAAEPLKAGVVGFLAQLLLVPLLIVTVLVLVVTLIGIPFLALIPFAILGLVAVCIVGFTAVAYRVGRMVAGRAGLERPSQYLAAMVGIVVLMSPVLLGQMVGTGAAVLLPLALPLLLFGFFVEYAAWTVGLGAVALSRFDRRPGEPSITVHP